MFDTKAADYLHEAHSVCVRSFTALVDGAILTFEPTAAFDRKLSEDDDEVLWLVSKRDDKAVWQEVARVRIPREAPHSAVVDEFRYVVKWNSLPSDVRLLRHVATIASGSDDWYDMAAQRLGVSPGELNGWIAGKPTPEDLFARLAVFVPHLRNEAFRMRIRAEQAYMLLEFFAPSGGGEDGKRRGKRPVGRNASRRGRSA
jgi:hypothetical protein